MLFTHRSLLVPVVIMVLASSCTTTPSPAFTDADRAAIAAVTEEATAIVNRSQDWDEYVSVYYAPDAMVFPPNHEAVMGREAIAEFLAGFPPISDMEFNQIEVDGAGDVAYVYGTYSMMLAMPGMEEPVPDRGKYIEIWRRQEDGTWQLTRDIFNSDMPLPEE